MYISDSKLIKQYLFEIAEPDMVKQILQVCKILIDLKKFDKTAIDTLLREVEIQEKTLPQQKPTFVVKMSDTTKAAQIQEKLQSYDATVEISNEQFDDLWVVISSQEMHYKRTLDSDLKKIFG